MYCPDMSYKYILCSQELRECCVVESYHTNQYTSIESVLASDSDNDRITEKLHTMQEGTK